MLAKSKLGLVAILVSSTMLLSACQEDPEAAANALFVTASQTVDAASKVTGRTEADLTQRVKLTEEALASFAKIVAEYPQSSVAVKIASERKVGNVDLAMLEADLASAKIELGCFSDKAKCIGLEIKKKFDGIKFKEARHNVMFGSVLASIYAEAGMTAELNAVLAVIDEDEDRVRALVWANQFEEALKAMGNPAAASLDTLTLLAYNLMENGQGDKAKELATAAVQNLPPAADQTSDRNLPFLAMVLARTGEKENALAILNSALDAAEKAEDYARFGAVQFTLRTMAKEGFPEEARANTARLRDAYENNELKENSQKASMACAFKEIGDAAASEEFLSPVRQDAERGALVSLTGRFAIQTLLGCDIKEPFVLSEAEKIIANPAAYGAKSKGEEHLIAAQMNKILGNNDAAIDAMLEAIKAHEIDLERGYESVSLLEQANSLLAELKKSN